MLFLDELVIAGDFVKDLAQNSQKGLSNFLFVLAIGIPVIIIVLLILLFVLIKKNYDFYLNK